MRTVKIIAQWIFSLCLPVLLFTFSVSLAANIPRLYEYGFNKYDVSKETGLTPIELEKVAHGLIGYWNSGDDTFNITVIKNGQPFTLFNEREVDHLKDVKGLFQLVYRVLIGTGVFALIFLGVCIFWWRDRRRLGWGLIGGGALTLILIAAVGIMAALNFDWFFLQFHLLSFANDFWQLNPATDYLIMLFPQGFWFDATLFCVGGTALLAVMLGTAGWWLKRKYKN